eukprot:6612011-Pyramimonas_sp.AAC.1
MHQTVEAEAAATDGGEAAAEQENMTGTVQKPTTKPQMVEMLAEASIKQEQDEAALLQQKWEDAKTCMMKAIRGEDEHTHEQTEVSKAVASEVSLALSELAAESTENVSAYMRAGPAVTTEGKAEYFATMSAGR